MKGHLLVIFALFLCIACAASNTLVKASSRTASPPIPTTLNERDKQEILRLLSASYKDKAAKLERLLDDNFVSFGINNQPRNKAMVMRSWATETNDPNLGQSVTSDNYEFYFYGDTAIVTSRITDILMYKDSETTNHSFNFDVWKKSNKGWQRIASRPTPLMERKATAVDMKTFDDYTGIYKSADSNSFTVTRDGGKLFVSIADGTKFELPQEGAKIDLVPQTEIEFYSPSNPYITVFFIRNDKGEVARAIVRFYTADTIILKNPSIPKLAGLPVGQLRAEQ